MGSVLSIKEENKLLQLLRKYKNKLIGNNSNNESNTGSNTGSNSSSIIKLWIYTLYRDNTLTIAVCLLDTDLNSFKRSISSIDVANAYIVTNNNQIWTPIDFKFDNNFDLSLSLTFEFFDENIRAMFSYAWDTETHTHSDECVLVMYSEADENSSTEMFRCDNCIEVDNVHDYLKNNMGLSALDEEEVYNKKGLVFVLN